MFENCYNIWRPFFNRNHALVNIKVFIIIKTFNDFVTCSEGYKSGNAHKNKHINFNNVAFSQSLRIQKYFKYFYKIINYPNLKNIKQKWNTFQINLK